MTTRSMELSEAERFVVYMLRTLGRPGAPDMSLHITRERVSLTLPGEEMNRPDHVTGRGGTLIEAHENLKAAMRLPPHD